MENDAQNSSIEECSRVLKNSRIVDISEVTSFPPIESKCVPAQINDQVEDSFYFSPNLPRSTSSGQSEECNGGLENTLSATQIEEMFFPKYGNINSEDNALKCKSDFKDQKNEGAIVTNDYPIRELGDTSSKDTDDLENSAVESDYGAIKHSVMHSTLLLEEDRENCFVSPQRRKIRHKKQQSVKTPESIKVVRSRKMPELSRQELNILFEDSSAIDSDMSETNTENCESSSVKSIESGVECNKNFLLIVRNIPPNSTSCSIVSLIKPFFPTMVLEAYVKPAKINEKRLVALLSFKSLKDLHSGAEFLNDKKIVYENGARKNSYQLRCDIPLGKDYTSATEDLEKCRKDMNRNKKYSTNVASASGVVPFTINKYTLPKTSVISIKNLPTYTNHNYFYNLFVKFQEDGVKDYAVEKSTYNGDPSVTGYIHFKNKYFADQAIKLLGPSSVVNQKIEVKCEEGMVNLLYLKYNIPSSLLNLGSGIGPNGRFLMLNDFDEAGNLKPDIR